MRMMAMELGMVGFLAMLPAAIAGGNEPQFVREIVCSDTAGIAELGPGQLRFTFQQPARAGWVLSSDVEVQFTSEGATLAEETVASQQMILQELLGQATYTDPHSGSTVRRLEYGYGFDSELFVVSLLGGRLKALEIVGAFEVAEAAGELPLFTALSRLSVNGKALMCHYQLEPASAFE